jgi:glutamate synthase (NADPH/NADH) small chain
MKIKKDLFSPLKAWKYAFKTPVSLSMEDIKDRPRESQDNARGFHINDLTKCIGCGACSEICPTEAIVMVKRKDLEDKEGEHPERPTMDYGRCCFCALCVDICTSGSLQMSKAYVLNTSDPQDLYVMPEEKFPAPGGDILGYDKTPESDLLDLKRTEMPAVAGDKAKKSFVEILKGFSMEQARAEAARCIGCEICVKTCPANMHVPEYIDAVWQGDLAEGLSQLYKTNPLPGICGSVCTHKCETVCAIGKRGEPVAIRWLKRYIVDNAPEAMYEEVLMAPVSKPGQGKVAVVGGGAAGMSASYYLRTMGYQVDLYEAKPMVGGVARYGVPAYRLPDDRLNKDVGLLEKIGVRFLVNTQVGQDISLDALHDQYDAVFLASGLPQSRSLKLENGDHPDVRYAMPFLAAARDHQRGTGEMPDVAEKVVVIGGGNVAFDVARTIMRLQQKKYGHNHVSLVSLETRDILPADLEEIEEGEAEGLRYHCGLGPQGIEVSQGKIQGLHTIKCLSVFDENRRFNPVFDQEQKKLIEGSQVYVAIGQMNEHTYFTPEHLERIAVKGGKVSVDDWGQVQGAPWLFAGGDIVHGPDMIHGIADGHQAARGIDRYLQSRAEKA